MKYFSMFSGVGGFDLALNRYGYDCVGCSEIDKYAIQTYNKNFKGVKNYGDARKINAKELLDFDLLCAGFPCQAFSIAGKRRGFDDTRGTLFFEIARIAEAKRPAYLLLENVKGLLNHEKGETFRVILQTLAELGYEVQWMVLNSKFFGVPQNRERVFIVGSLGGKTRPEILPFGESKKLSNQEERGEQKSGQGLRSKISSTIDSRYGALRNAGETYILQKNQREKVMAVLTPNRPKKRQHGRRFKEDGEEMFTLTGQDVHGVEIQNSTIDSTPHHIIGGMQKHAACMKYQSTALTEAMGKGGGHTPILDSIRRLTPLECERLQGFPNNWTAEGVNGKGEIVKISDTQRYKMMGNAVTVNVVEAIIKNLKKCQ